VGGGPRRARAFDTHSADQGAKYAKLGGPDLASVMQLPQVRRTTRPGESGGLVESTILDRRRGRSQCPSRSPAQLAGGPFLAGETTLVVDRGGTSERAESPHGGPRWRQYRQFAACAIGAFLTSGGLQASHCIGLNDAKESSENDYSAPHVTTGRDATACRAPRKG